MSGKERFTAHAADSLQEAREKLQPHTGFLVRAVYRALLEEGCIVGYYLAGNLLRLTPSLTIPESNLVLLRKDWMRY